MSPIVETLAQTLVDEWQEYFPYWSAAHNSDSQQEYRTFTHSEIARAQMVCNRLQQLDDCFNHECNEYNSMLTEMSNMMR